MPRPVHLSGNRCGHDPRHPRLADGMLRATNACAGPLSSAIINIGRWLTACFDSASLSPLFSRRSGRRQIRSERREACLMVLMMLLWYLEPETLSIGIRLADGRFAGLLMKDIVRETGLGLRRCERVISDLKRIGALERNSAPGQPQLAFTRVFIDWISWESSEWELEQFKRGQSDFGVDGGQP